jgi:hypothetical protein
MRRVLALTGAGLVGGVLTAAIVGDMLGLALAIGGAIGLSLGVSGRSRTAYVLSPLLAASIVTLAVYVFEPSGLGLVIGLIGGGMLAAPAALVFTFLHRVYDPKRKVLFALLYVGAGILSGLPFWLSMDDHEIRRSIAMALANGAAFGASQFLGALAAGLEGTPWRFSIPSFFGRYCETVSREILSMAPQPKWMLILSLVTSGFFAALIVGGLGDPGIDAALYRAYLGTILALGGAVGVAFSTRIWLRMAISAALTFVLSAAIGSLESALALSWAALGLAFAHDFYTRLRHSHRAAWLAYPVMVLLAGTPYGLLYRGWLLLAAVALSQWAGMAAAVAISNRSRELCELSY